MRVLDFFIFGALAVINIYIWIDNYWVKSVIERLEKIEERLEEE